MNEGMDREPLTTEDFNYKIDEENEITCLSIYKLCLVVHLCTKKSEYASTLRNSAIIQMLDHFKDQQCGGEENMRK